MKYSFYESRFSTKCRQVTVAELLEIIGKPTLKEMCEKIVEAMKVGDDEEVEKLKSKMPGVVVSELYKAGAPRIAGTGEPTGLVMIDYDYCKTEEELKELCEKVQRLSIVHAQLKDLIVAAHISQRRHGVHVWFRWIDGCQTVEECQAKFAEMADLPGYDTDCTGVNRFCGLVHKSMFFVQNWGAMERNEAFAALQKKVWKDGTTESRRSRKKDSENPETRKSENPGEAVFHTDYKGVAYKDIIAEWWRRTGGEPVTGDRNALLHKLAVNLRAICSNDEEWLLEVMPDYGLPPKEMQSIVHSACKEPTKGSSMIMEIVKSLKANYNENDNENDNKEGLDLEDNSSIVNSQLSINRMPMGVRDSIEAASPSLAMMMVTAICPCIGALATGVSLDVHGDKRGLNLISYIVGDPGSGKGKVDPVVDEWMAELRALDKMYEDQEKDWRRRKVAAKNKKEQPEEIALPVRCLTLNNTVANLAERLSNTEGKHAFSFTPEADTVAQKWKSTMSDFSVMLRQGYDGSRYEREARSAEAVNVHIEHLLWNVTMCGTPDALYRVVSNYTDGLQTRIAVASAIDNTFLQLEDKNPLLTDKQSENIRMIAHLLPLMHGEAVLPKLEQTGRAWLERIRLETMMNDDKVKARQRFRICVTAQRMTCCLMLCKVCEQLIQKHGLSGAESRLKQNPNLWKEMLLKTQTPSMLAIYDVIADSLMENALFYFRERIENAYNSRNYAGSQGNGRVRRTKNDSIYARLDLEFTFEQAMQQTIAIKGAGVTRNSVQQMLKNWCNQGLSTQIEKGKFRKNSH